MTSRSLVLFIVMILAAVSVGGHDLFLNKVPGINYESKWATLTFEVK